MTKHSDSPKLFIHMELDLTTQTAAVETNIIDPSVMLRVLGQSMHIWANDKMEKQVAAIANNGGRRLPVILPSTPRKVE